jgi:ABC-2 type transport system permease protein
VISEVSPPQRQDPVGPSAFGGSFRRFVELTLTLAHTDFKLRYFGSVLGYFWSLARPLLFFGVLYVFFTQILHVGAGIPNYGVYLLTGIVLWSFFAEATGNAVSCLVARETLLRKVRFPRLAIPIAVTLTSVFNLTMNLIAVVVFALISGVYPELSWLWMVPIVLGFITMALGVSLLLSALYVRFRDVQPIWDVFSQILFYSSPIMYVASSYRSLEHIALLNPFALMMTQMGHSFVHPPLAPTLAVYKYHQGLVATSVAGKIVLHHGTIATLTPGVLTEMMRSGYTSAGGLAHVLASIAVMPLVLALGLWFFAREAPRVAENL